MTRKLKGLASWKLLPLWAAVLGSLALVILLSPTAVLLADEPDADGDELPDDLELIFGSNPLEEDSDSDGWLDGAEVWEHGTSPTDPDTDGDSLDDPEDDHPLLAGDTDGGSAVTYAWSSNLEHETLVGTSSFDGNGVNVSSGEFLWSYVMDFGPSIVPGGAKIVMLTRSGTLYDGNLGYSVFSNADQRAEETSGGNINICWYGQNGTFVSTGSGYTSPAGWPFKLSLDTQANTIILTTIRGGLQHIFNRSSGHLIAKKTRCGAEESYSRAPSGRLLSILTAEGLTITAAAYTTDRIRSFTGPDNRAYTIYYNCAGDLARIVDPEGSETQVRQTHGSQQSTLNHNYTLVMDPMGRTVVENRYDSSDRVTKQIRGNHSFTFSYDTQNNKTTVYDPTGAKREYTFGSPVATQLKVFSNLNVNPANPASWTTTMTYNSNWLRTKVLFPRGNSIKYTWDSNYCLTQKRKKQVDTQPDNNNTDLIWSYTYGTTYFKLKNSTDPMGNTTQRTLDSLERVTLITYPTITHTDPDITITESNTWNSNGTIDTHTDGKGSVTKYQYYSSGNKTNLLWKVTRDYGVGKLNLADEYDYDSARFTIQKKDPDGNIRAFLVDAMGRRTKETIDPTGLNYETKYTYDLSGRVTLKEVENVDGDGDRVTALPWWSTTFSYTSFGELSGVTETIDATTTRTTTKSYTANGQIEIVTLPKGNKVKAVYEERGMIFRRIRGSGSDDEATDEFTYDANGNLTVRKDGRGKNWTSAYDLYDRKIKDTTPLGHYASLVLDKNGRVPEVKSYNSSDTLLAHRKRSYDEVGRSWKSERWLDNPAPAADEWMATSYVHNNRGDVVEVTDPLDHTRFSTYDASGRLTEVEDHLGNSMSFGYTADCCSATEIETIENVPGGGTQTFRTEFVLDALNRVTERRIIDRTDSNNKHVFTTKYTSLGIAVEEQDAEGNRTYRAHNGLRWVTREVRDLGGGDQIDAWYSYDLNGNLTSLKDDDLNETIYRFNARGVLDEIEYDDGEKRTLTLLDDDLVSGWTDENGTVVTNTYNNDGLLTARSINRANGVLGPTSESYTWDGLGRLTEAKNTDTTVQRTWNTLSQLVTETQGPNPIGQAGKTFTYTFADDGGRESIEYPSGFRLDYTSDAVGRWELIEDGNGNDLVANSFYGGGFRYAAIGYLNGIDAAFGYDGFRFLTGIDHKTSGSVTLAGFEYAYDGMGNPLCVEQVHDSGSGNLYAYDKAYRLVSALMGSADPLGEAADDDWADYAHVDRIDYNMDDVSNRENTAHTPYQGSATTVSYSANNLNQYTLIGANSQVHDDNGNLTDDGVSDMAYDYRNNLVQVAYGAVIFSACEFDALGRRTSQTTLDGNFTTAYFYDGEHVLEEYDGSDELLRKFVYGQRIDEIRVMISPDYADVDDDQNTTEVLSFYYHHSLLGTVTHITDEGENVVESYEYTPYGQTTIKDINGSTIPTSVIKNPYMYTARRLDEGTGLYHYRRRAYDPERGRFMQRDPLHYEEGLNLLAYSKSSPLLYRDPRGTSPSSYAEYTGESRVTTSKEQDELRAGDLQLYGLTAPTIVNFVKLSCECELKHHGYVKGYYTPSGHTETMLGHFGVHGTIEYWFRATWTDWEPTGDSIRIHASHADAEAETTFICRVVGGWVSGMGNNPRRRSDGPKHYPPMSDGGVGEAAGQLLGKIISKSKKEEWAKRRAEQAEQFEEECEKTCADKKGARR